MLFFICDRSLNVGDLFLFKKSLGYLKTSNTWFLIMAAAETKKANKNIISTTTTALTEVHTGEKSTVNINKSNDCPPTTLSCSSDKNRPPGTKRPLDQSRQILALHTGADTLESVVEATHKKGKEIRAGYLDRQAKDDGSVTFYA